MDCNQFCLRFNIMTASFMKGQKPSKNSLGILSSKAHHFITKGTREGHLRRGSCALAEASKNCFSKAELHMFPA